MLKTSSRTILLRYVPIVAVLSLDLFFFALLDNLFVNKKRVLIVDSLAEFDQMLEVIQPVRKDLGLMGPTQPPYTQRAMVYLEKNAPALLEGEHPWFRIVLTDAEGKSVKEWNNPEKFRRFNNWKNCFLSQSFYARVGNKDIQLTIYYATPMGWPKIESLVFRYWIYALLFTAATWILYFLLSRNVFRPLLHVHTGIERIIRSDRVALIPRPMHDIELAFNRLVRNQREVVFGLEVDQIVDRLHTIADDTEVLVGFLRALESAIQRAYPFHGVEAFAWNSRQNQWMRPGEDSSVPPEFSKNEETVFFEIPTRLCVFLRVGEDRSGALRCPLDPLSNLPRDEYERMGHEILKQSENGLARSLTRSRALIEERNRFGINLATNMGHDLTNIIASGKWDLDTIQRAQMMGIVQMDFQKGKFFLDAVNGLRNNIDFLQQMVDIYRSFGYTQRPRFETTNVVQLVRDTTGLFRLATSQKLSFALEVPPALDAVIEPRLMRMMLFNLLANAAQAILRSQPSIVDGKIALSLATDRNRHLTLRVQDNGPGIRNRNGELLSAAEINCIFQSGFTTKEKGSGAGLGLAWVKSIIEDFHNGTIYAVNLPEGGAAITIEFPQDRQEEPSNGPNSPVGSP